MLIEGEVLDSTYQIMYKIGSGGTGDVYLAYHLRLEKYVVVKKIKDNFVGHVNVRAEVDILKKLKHTYLPQVYDFVQMGTTVYTVMDYIEGCDLATYINEGYFVEEDTLLKWLRQLCEVLEYLHSQTPPIIHSDLKPENIMITNDDNVCLIDFNISLDGDDSSQITGISLPYASPEQLEKARLFVSHLPHRHIVLDGRTDMYSLAASFYCLMTGQPPANPDMYSIPLSQWELPYNEGIACIIDRAMSHDVEQRYEDMGSMLKDVHSVYKKTGRYKLYLVGSILSAAVYLTAVGFGIWCMVHGASLKVSEAYHKINKQFIAYYDEGDYINTIDTGYDLLNDNRFRKLLDSSKSDKIEVLHILGECYFQNEDYAAALEFYTGAIKLIKNKAAYSEYYRDYVVALIRCGYIEAAQDKLEQIKAEGVEAADIALLNAEMLIYHEQYEEALSIIEALRKENITADTKIHILVLGSDAAADIRDYQRQIAYLEEAYDLSGMMSVERKLGNAYMQLVNREKLTKGEMDTYTKKAVKCYEELTEKSYSSMNDSINLAICYRVLGKYDKSIKVLKELEKESTDYRIYMNLAFGYDKNGEAERAKTYTKKALQQYSNTPENERESEGSDHIQSLKELEKKYE